jgi:heat shock protein HtpX
LELREINVLENGQVCPECNAVIPFNKGYVSWCDCGYNLDTPSAGKTVTKLQRLYERLGEKRGDGIYKNLSGQQELRQGPSFSKGMAFLLASLVHLISIGSLTLGIFFVIFHNNNYFLLAGGLILLGIAWMARPRVPALEKGEWVISRQDFPDLYQVVDQLADAMKVTKIDGIIITGDFNASVTQIGWRRKGIVTIGLPLFSILEPEEQLAVLAHEFGHISNGDLTRSFYIGTSLYTLQTWYELLEPVPIDEYDNFGLFEIPVYYFMAFLAQIPYSIFFLLVHLLFDASQKGEYLADNRAAKAVGYQHLISTLKKFQFEEAFHLKVRELAVRKKEVNLFEAVKEQINSMPVREKERLYRIAQLESSKFDSTHPPTFNRIQLLEKFRTIPDVSAVDRVVLVKMQKELETQQSRVQDQIIEDYRYYLNMW